MKKRSGGRTRETIQVSRVCAMVGRAPGSGGTPVKSAVKSWHSICAEGRSAFVATSKRERTHRRLNRQIRRPPGNDRQYVDPHKHRFAPLSSGASKVAGCERDGDSLWTKLRGQLRDPHRFELRDGTHVEDGCEQERQDGAVQPQENELLHQLHRGGGGRGCGGGSHRRPRAAGSRARQ